MLFDGLFEKSDIIQTAMNASIVRGEVINNNIANVDTPDFKKSRVEFENILSKELNSAKSLSDIDINSLKPVIHTEISNYSYRLDGNNVDIEEEMAASYQNTVRYDVMSSSIMGVYESLNLVITGIK